MQEFQTSRKFKSPFVQSALTVSFQFRFSLCNNSQLHYVVSFPLLKVVCLFDAEKCLLFPIFMYTWRNWSLMRLDMHIVCVAAEILRFVKTWLDCSDSWKKKKSHSFLLTFANEWENVDYGMNRSCIEKRGSKALHNSLDSKYPQFIIYFSVNDYFKGPACRDRSYICMFLFPSAVI